MATNTTPIRIELTTEERGELERLSRSLVAAHRLVVRAVTILLLARGMTLSSVAREVGRTRRIVRKWGERFVRKRLRGLDESPRSGHPSRFSPQRGSAPGQAGV